MSASGLILATKKVIGRRNPILFLLNHATVHKEKFMNIGVI